MKTSAGIFRFVLVIILVFGLMLTSCRNSPPSPHTVLAGSPNPTPVNFDFMYRFGTNGLANALDTFNGTFTKDMVTDPPVTADVPFTQQDMDMIYRKMVEIDFFSYPGTLRPTDGSSTIPSSLYLLEVKLGDQTKTVYWVGGYVNPDDIRRLDLMSLDKLIQDILTSKDEYKRMPKPTSFYI